MESLTGTRQLLVHCATGARSAVAAALLDSLGYAVQYVSDRFDQWSALDDVATGEPLVAT